jgi:23S rRNA (guanosine2251-2'-O)-methyltransferase
MQGTDYTQIDYTGSIALVIGNEGSGMSQLVKKSCDFIASISMQGKTNSLNASVATGIVVFEAVNCRRNRGL